MVTDVQALVKQAQRLLQLELCTIAIETPNEEDVDPDHRDADAHCRTNFPYYNATIIFNPAFFTRSSERQWHIVLHELAHIITVPMKALLSRYANEKAVTWQEVLDRNEELTDRIAKLVEKSIPPELPTGSSNGS